MSRQLGSIVCVKSECNVDFIVSSLGERTRARGEWRNAWGERRACKWCNTNGKKYYNFLSTHNSWHVSISLCVYVSLLTFARRKHRAIHGAIKKVPHYEDIPNNKLVLMIMAKKGPTTTRHLKYEARTNTPNMQYVYVWTCGRVRVWWCV